MNDIIKSFNKIRETMHQLGNDIQILSGQLHMIEDQIKNTSQDSSHSISDIRQMESMQMIEEILNGPNTSIQTMQFITGLKDHYSNRGTLSESQRFHLETTYSGFRQNSES